jgi:rubrerythrin
VLVRAKRTQNIQRRRSANGHAQGRPAAAAPKPELWHEQRPAAERLTNDRAFYSCQCGYVFEAPVSTSVGCPHCGGTQAW